MLRQECEQGTIDAIEHSVGVVRAGSSLTGRFMTSEPPFIWLTCSLQNIGEMVTVLIVVEDAESCMESKLVREKHSTPIQIDHKLGVLRAPLRCSPEVKMIKSFAVHYFRQIRRLSKTHDKLSLFGDSLVPRSCE